MASPYEAYKVRELVTAYRSNPTMFTDDQLDQLEELAYNNDIQFKRQNSEFDLSRAVRNAFAGAVEGFTTFDLIPEQPRNTGEAIFRQLGHLVGFAPGIAKAPILAASKVAQRIAGKKALSPLSSTLQRNPFTQAALDHLDVLSTMSVPMQFSRLSKKGLDKVLNKTGADSAEFLKRGTVGRQIIDEAVGLGSASAISNIWRGQDAVVDGFIGGAVAGGAFGGIGNFISLGNLYKGTPQQVERANQILRAGVGSLITGLPYTLANEPTEMQIYNYLLGGFFGYTARPAREKEASRWYEKDRNAGENFRPEESKDWGNISKQAKDYIRYEHPMGFESSNGQAGGSAGVALGYLNRKAQQAGQNINFRQRAIDHFNNNNIEYKEKDILYYYRTKALEEYDRGRKSIENAVVFRNNIYNNEQLDQMDTVERNIFSLKNTSKRIFSNTDKFQTSTDVAVTVDNIAGQSNRDIETFMSTIKDTFGNKAISKKVNQDLRTWFTDKIQIMQPIDLPVVGGNNARIKLVDKVRYNDVTIGEKTPTLPIQKMIPNADIHFMTHVIKPDADGNMQAVKVLEQNLDSDNNIEYAVNQKELGLINSSLAENNRYIYSANKDKLNVFTSVFRDDRVTLDDIFNIFSRSGKSTEELQKLYDDALELEYELFGKSDATANIFKRKFISNVVNEAELERIPLDEAYRFLQQDSPYLKDVVDFNKRMQLPTTRMPYMSPSSFTTVEGTNNGSTFNMLIIPDAKNVVDTDGGSQWRTDFIDSAFKAYGTDEKLTGVLKPVIGSNTNLGVYFQKSDGGEAFPAMQEFMKKNNIHVIAYESSAKRKGNLPVTKLNYGKDGKYTVDGDLGLITLPIQSIQVSTGTKEVLPKDMKGTNLALQFYGQVNNTQASGYKDVFFNRVTNNSNAGTPKAREIVESFQKTEDLDAFIKSFQENKLNIDQLPIDFARSQLFDKASEPVSLFLSDRLMKAENSFQLDEPSYETFEADSDKNYGDYHSENDLLANATQGTFIPRHTLSFNKNNYFNALRKYFTKRITNPFIHTAGKSWLKPFNEAEVTQYIEFDPLKKGNRNIKQGEIYIGNAAKQMPVVFRNEQLTLSELWSKYTRAVSKGLSKEDRKAYEDALTFLIIRTPADSISGIRAVRFRGWTNQKGAGSLLHSKDKEYIGGADNDSDSIKIFQGLGSDLAEFYRKNQFERDNLTQQDYDRMNNLFLNKDIPESLRNGFKEKFNIFSPSHRFLAGRNSSTGKDGLGFGLAGKGYLMNQYDYVVSQGGKIKAGNVIVTAKDKNSFKEFLNRATMIVNKSADASKDPAVLPYNKHRDLLLEQVFDVRKNGKPITSYSEFSKEIKGSKLEAIKDSVRLSKPRQTTFLPDGRTKVTDIFEYKNQLNQVKDRLGEDGLDQVYVAVNRELQKVFEDGINFSQINTVQKLLYDQLKNTYVNQQTGKLKILESKKKFEKYLSKHFNIITDELSFATPNRHIKNMESNPDQALDIFGKDIGQYATMELLTKQFVDIQNAFTEKGRLVNVIDDVLPNLKGKAFEIKDYVQDILKLENRDNTMNLDVDAKIRSTMDRLQDMERGLQDGLLQDYFSYWLLSPIRRNPNPEKPAQPQYYKMLHSSRAIPMRAKKAFYQQMDDIFTRTLKENKGSVTLKKPLKIEESIIGNNFKSYDSINKIVREGGLQNIAISKQDSIEVDKLTNFIDKHRVDDFNNWFTQFMEKNGRGLRDVTTITMDDVKFLNNYFNDLNTSKGLKFGLKNYYMSPMEISRQMEMMNFHTRGLKIRDQVKTSTGTVERDYVKILSPVGSISDYGVKVEGFINKYELQKDKARFGIETQLKTLPSIKDRNLYMDNIIEYREGRKKLEDLDAKIDQAKFLKLNNEITKFNKDMWEFWVTTKDISGRELNWNTIDVDHKYGKINEFMRYKNNGAFDFKLFTDKVINANQHTDQIINKVGIDGIMRYRYEYKLEKSIRNKADKQKERERLRQKVKFVPRKKRDYSTYIHHSIRNVPEGILLEQAKWLNKQAAKQDSAGINRLQREIALDNPFVDINDRIVIEPEMDIPFEQSAGTIASPLKKRGTDPIPFKRSPDLFVDYQDALIKGYFRNLMKFKAQGDIDAFLYNMRDYKPSNSETKHFTNLYKGISKSELPDNMRYNNYVDVWADFIRMHAEMGMGYQTQFSSKMKTKQGRELLHLNKKNLFYVTSDEVVANQLEKLFQSKLGKNASIPIFNKEAIPKDPQLRQIYFYNKIRSFGRGEAQYQLLSLLANTGTFTTNIFGGSALTMGSAGIRNFIDAQRNSAVRDILLTDSKGANKVFLRNGTPVNNIKQLNIWMEESGFYDNYLQNEFEVNTEGKARFRELGINIKDFSRDLLTAIKNRKGNREENISDVLKKYGVTESMVKAGGFLMQKSERINRRNAYIAHALQAIRSMKDMGSDLTLADKYVQDYAMKGIEMTQFLYQNFRRPMFMATTTGKVLSRFKLFAFNSVRVRKEFYRQAKAQGLKPNTQAYESFRDTFVIDMIMYALGAAFMFSLFDTTLPPPYDWIQAFADYTFGTKKQKEMAYFNDPLGPLTILKPPIARVPEAMFELISGDMEEFTGYTMYTLLPFGRGIRQAVQLSDDRVGRGLERAPEILFRIPYNQFQNRLERAKTKRERNQLIQDLLEDS